LKALLTFGVQGMVAGTLVTGAVVGASHYLEVHGPARGTEGAATREQDGHGARTRSASRVVPPSANVGVSRLTTIDEPKAPLDGAPDEEVTRPDAFRAVQVGARKAAPSVTFVPDEMPRVAPTASTRDRFTDEIRAFERAQSALNRSDVGGARAALDTYDRTFPRGALALEAEVLRIEILGAEGDRPALRARARAFLDKNPSVPEARRIQNLLERSEEHTE